MVTLDEHCAESDDDQRTNSPCGDPSNCFDIDIEQKESRKDLKNLLIISSISVVAVGAAYGFYRLVDYLSK